MAEKGNVTRLRTVGAQVDLDRELSMVEARARQIRRQQRQQKLSSKGKRGRPKGTRNRIGPRAIGRRWSEFRKLHRNLNLEQAASLFLRTYREMIAAVGIKIGGPRSYSRAAVKVRLLNVVLLGEKLHQDEKTLRQLRSGVLQNISGYDSRLTSAVYLSWLGARSAIGCDPFRVGPISTRANA